MSYVVVMKAKIPLLAILIVLGVALPSCKPDKPISSVSAKRVFTIEEILRSSDKQLSSLLNKVRGSVGTRGPASKTIWSRKNDYGLGLYISANHVYNLSGWRSPNAQFLDLTATNAGIFETSQIPPANGTVQLGNTLIADFPFIHFDISPTATNTTILPAEDFYVGIIDNQRVEQGPFPKYPGIVQTATPLALYDPANRTRADETWSLPVPGENALAVGYPQDKVNYPNGGVSYGKILSDAEVRKTLLELKAAGDSEGDVPYAADVEFFVNAPAVAGMSGGGVFNAAGQLLGIMVRASNEEKAPPIIRVVKIAYIKSTLIRFYNGLTEPEKSKIKPHISGEM